MTYHQERNILLCHYCGMEVNVPSSCSNCGAEYIYFVGVGTEQLEEVLHKLLPKARLARLDRDTTRRRGTLRKILLDFSAGRLDILVGTQILAKGHDFPNVTLVGVVAADAGLQFPDFRSAERTFQLLTQVAGRAGRGETPGHVVIQSFYPDHYALRFARQQDYPAFYSHEVEFRRQLHYPPFTRLVQILVADPDADRAFKTAEKIASALKSCAGSRGHGRMQVLGPASAPLEKLRGEFRVQILMKVHAGEDPAGPLSEAFHYLGGHRVPLRRVHVDIDPLSLL
jgi:primosomal protein N' (replication factor Y)